MALASEILADSELSQAELARRAGMPRSVVNAYVRGKREPGEKALLRLVAAGGLEIKLVWRKPPVKSKAGRQAPGSGFVACGGASISASA